MTVAVAVVVIHYMVRVTEWRVMSDELLYLDLSRSMAQNLSPLPVVRGEHVAFYSVLYPLIIAPFVGLLDAPTAFKAIRVVNVAVIVSTAVPAYLLAREASGRFGALVAATLSILVPWITASASVMTEVAAYPAFTWAAYAMTRAIAVPSMRQDLLALVAIGIACLARTQFALLVVAFPVAVLLHEMGQRVARDGVRSVQSIFVGAPLQAVRSHVVATVAVGGGVIFLLFKANTVLGSYGAATTQGTLLPGGIAGSALDHLAYITVGIGALPVVFAIAFVVGTLGRAVDPRSHALASIVLVVVVATTLVVTSFDLRFIVQGRAVQERYLFYIAPPLFAGAVAWFAHGRPRLVPLAIGAVAAAGIVLSQSYKPVPEVLIEGFASPNRYFFAVLDGRLGQVEGWLGLHSGRPGPAIVIAAACLLTAAVAVVVVRKAGARVALATFGLAMGVYLASQLVYILPRVAEDHNRFARGILGIRPLATRDWVDHHEPQRSTGAVVGPINTHLGNPDVAPYLWIAEWWDVAFWNKSVDRIYSYAGDNTRAAIAGALITGPIGQLSLDFGSGAMRATGASAPEQLLLANDDIRFAPAYRGPPLQNGDLTLYRTPFPYRADWATRGIDDDGWTRAGRTVVVRVYGRRGAPAVLTQVRIVLRAGSNGAHRYTLTGGGVSEVGTVRARRIKHVQVCAPAGGHVDLKLRVHGGIRVGDRVVGMQVLRIQTQSSGKSCRAG